MKVLLVLLLFSNVCLAKPVVYLALNENAASKQIKQALNHPSRWVQSSLRTIRRDLDIVIVEDPSDQPAICPAISINHQPWQRLPELQVEQVFWIDVLLYVRDELYYQHDLEKTREINSKLRNQYTMDEWDRIYSFLSKKQEENKGFQFNYYMYYSVYDEVLKLKYCPAPEPFYYLEPEIPVSPVKGWELE